MFRLIRDSFKNVICIVLLIEGSGRTGSDTLTASHTAGLSQPHLKCRADECGKAPVIGSDHTHRLYLLTHRGTSAAENALIVIADHMYCTCIQLIVIPLSCEMILIIHSQFLTEFLEFTAPAADTGETFLIMGR